MKKVCVLTDFQYLPPQYGLVPAVMGQLRMLVKFGYKPTLITMEGFRNHEDAKKVPEGVEMKDILPAMHLFDYQLGTTVQEYEVGPMGEKVGNDPPRTNLAKQVKLVTETIEDELCRHEVIIEHDMLFQVAKIPFNQAIRDIGGRHPELKWLHWMHSGPSPRPDNPVYPHILRYTGMNNSVFVTMNETMRSKFAETYNVPIKDIKCVYHAVDVGAFKEFHPLSIALIEKYKLLDPEILCVFPTRLDHPLGKGVDYAVRLMAQMNKITTAKLLFCNSWSSGEAAKNTITSLKQAALSYGLPEDSLIFTSEMGKQYENSVPRKVVADMYDVGNLFVMPAQSETFSLVTIEAALTKNFLVLNDDLKVFEELMGQESAKYVGFGSEWGGLRTDRNYQPHIERFMMDRAREIYDEIKACKPLQAHRRALQRFNSDYIFRNQLEPLLEN